MSIVVAVDFSVVTDRLLEQARMLAGWSGASIRLVHVAAPDPDFVGYDVGPQHVRDRLAEHFREEHQHLHRMAEALRSSGVDATAVLVQGNTAEMVLKEAAQVNAEMVVIGSHGHGALFHALMGSVGSSIVRQSRCPVLVVPSRGAEPSVSGRE